MDPAGTRRKDASGRSRSSETSLEDRTAAALAAGRGSARRPAARDRSRQRGPRLRRRRHPDLLGALHGRGAASHLQAARRRRLGARDARGRLGDRRCRSSARRPRVSRRWIIGTRPPRSPDLGLAATFGIDGRRLCRRRRSHRPEHWGDPFGPPRARSCASVRCPYPVTCPVLSEPRRGSRRVPRVSCPWLADGPVPPPRRVGPMVVESLAGRGSARERRRGYVQQRCAYM